MEQRRESGSALILMPAAVLVVLILGVIAVDSAVAYLGRRALIDFTTSAADDAAAKALDRDAFYGPNGELRIQPQAAEDVVDQLRVVEGHSGGLEITDARADVSADGRTVVVTARGTVHEIFGPGVTGQRTITVRAQAEATVAEVQVRPK